MLILIKGAYMENRKFQEAVQIGVTERDPTRNFEENDWSWCLPQTKR
jgi:hypothetical protein